MYSGNWVAVADLLESDGYYMNTAHTIDPEVEPFPPEAVFSISGAYLCG